MNFRDLGSIGGRGVIENPGITHFFQNTGIRWRSVLPGSGIGIQEVSSRHALRNLRSGVDIQQGKTRSVVLLLVIVQIAT